MSVFTFILLVVTVSLVAGLIKTHLEQRNGRRHLGQDLEQTLAKLDALEERIRVLERIVTERPVDLKQQIDSL